MARDFNIAKPTGTCVACERTLEEGEGFTATLREGHDGFRREDFCLSCWPQRRERLGDDVFGVWRAQVPRAKEKKKLFVDDDVLLSFFHRLADEEAPDRVAFRYVLTLILMRKKLLTYERSYKRDDAAEVWQVRPRGGDQLCEVVNPRITEEEIRRVGEQLSQILEADL